jgi:hypothetical protein
MHFNKQCHFLYGLRRPVGAKGYNSKFTKIELSIPL